MESQSITQSHDQEDGLTQMCPLSRAWQARHPGPPRVWVWKPGSQNWTRKLSREPSAHGGAANRAEEVKPGRRPVAAVSR